MTTPAHIFRDLIRKTMATNTLVVKFTPEAKGPRYLPKDQACRRDGKAVIEMPCSEYRIIDQHATDSEIDNVLSKITTADALLVFSHEYGHHLTQNPGYDEALKRCLTLPVNERDRTDIELVVKEESEAWSLGFAELESLGFEIPESFHQQANKLVEEYRQGVTSAEPKKPSHSGM